VVLVLVLDGQERQERQQAVVELRGGGLRTTTQSPSELNAAGGASVGPACQCLQAIPN
jgi:hypothetical protein